MSYMLSMLSFLCNYVWNHLAVSEWKLSIHQFLSVLFVFICICFTTRLLLTLWVSSVLHWHIAYLKDHNRLKYFVDHRGEMRMRQTRKYEAIKSNHNCFLQCRVLLQNNFLSSPNNMDGYLFFEWVCSMQADSCELLGDVKWILYWVCPQHFWFNMHWCLYLRVSVLDSQSCIRAPQTHWAEGRVPGAGCGVYASTPTHFLSHYAHPDFASPSQQDRETPFCLCVAEIQRNQALCKTRLSLAQTPTAFAASTGLESFPRGPNYLGWTSYGDKVGVFGYLTKWKNAR